MLKWVICAKLLNGDFGGIWTRWHGNLHSYILRRTSSCSCNQWSSTTLLEHSLITFGVARMATKWQTSELTWHNHINKIKKKANSTLGFLKRNLSRASVNCKKTAYLSLVLPILEYGCISWDPYKKMTFKKFRKFKEMQQDSFQEVIIAKNPDV